MVNELFLKNPNEFVNTNIFIDLKDKICHHKEGIVCEYFTQILDAKHKQVNTNRVTTNQKHVNINYCHNLQYALAKYGNPFYSSLGVYPHQKVHIDLLSGSKLAHHCAYMVPCAYEKHSKRNSNTWLILELLRNVVPLNGPCLALSQTNFWSSLSHHLFKYKQYQLPLIHNVVQGISGYKYFTKLDTLMKYFSLELDEESQELCVIMTPFGQIQLYMLTYGPKMRSWFCLTNYGTGPLWAW